MITSGLVLTLTANPDLAQQARASLAARRELTLGQAAHRWLPAVAEAEDVPASRDLHDWLQTVPGVEFVDVVHVNFDDAEPTAAETPNALL
jgi:hypothetical protein